MKISSHKKNPVSPYLFMQFMEPLGTADSSVDAGWDYVREEWRPRLIDAVRDLAPGMVRWGGCFASYYHWREAVGPMDRRRPMLNLCWDGLYANHVGTKEFVGFCRAVGAEPLLVVNMESDGRLQWAHPRPGDDRLGTAEEAADWVRYCNSPLDPLRLSHGQTQPFNVKYWQIGNETSYDKNGYSLPQAVHATKRFAAAMKQADPSIHLIAWGDDGWARPMAEETGEDVPLIAFHHHFDSGLPDSPLNGTAYRCDPQKTWDHLMHAHLSLAEHIARVRQELSGTGKHIAVTEGHFALPGRNRCEVLSSWMAGAAYALCLNEFVRNSDIIDIATMADFFGNRWQVNAMLLPTPMRDTGRPYLQPVGQVMKLFGRHIGRWAVDNASPEGLDCTATRDDDTLFVHLVNPSLSCPREIAIDIDGVPAKSIRAFVIAPDDPTQEITELNPDAFDPVMQSVTGNRFTVPAAAVCALEIPLP